MVALFAILDSTTEAHQSDDQTTYCQSPEIRSDEDPIQKKGCHDNHFSKSVPGKLLGASREPLNAVKRLRWSDGVPVLFSPEYCKETQQRASL